MFNNDLIIENDWLGQKEVTLTNMGVYKHVAQWLQITIVMGLYDYEIIDDEYHKA